MSFCCNFTLFGGVLIVTFVLQNPGEEDTMVVQHILAVRKGKRELRKDPEPVEPKPVDQVDAENAKDETPESSDTVKKEESQPSETCDNGDEQTPKEGDDSQKTESGSSETEKPVTEETEAVEKASVEADQPEKTDSESVKDEKMDVDKEEGESESEEKEDAKEKSESTVKEEDEDEDKKDDDDKKDEDKKDADKKSDDKKDEDKEWIEVDEFYVKYRNFSYLHCEWKTEEELLKGDKRVQGKIKRFFQKQAHLTNIFENVSWFLSYVILICLKLIFRVL